jgi:hypothetical protein
LSSLKIILLFDMSFNPFADFLEAVS